MALIVDPPFAGQMVPERKTPRPAGRGVLWRISPVAEIATLTFNLPPGYD